MFTMVRRPAAPRRDEADFLLQELTAVLEQLEPAADSDRRTGGGAQTRLRARKILMAVQTCLRGAQPAHVALGSVAAEALALIEDSDGGEAPLEVVAVAAPLARLRELSDAPAVAAADDTSEDGALIDRYNRDDLTRLEGRRRRPWKH